MFVLFLTCQTLKIVFRLLVTSPVLCVRVSDVKSNGNICVNCRFDRLAELHISHQYLSLVKRSVHVRESVRCISGCQRDELLLE